MGAGSFVLDVVVGMGVTLLVIFFILVVPWSRARDWPRLDSAVSIDNVVRSCQTGDVLGVCYPWDMHNHFLRVFTKSVWSHVAFIWVTTTVRNTSSSQRGRREKDKERQQAYVIEMEPRGLRRTLLRPWLLRQLDAKRYVCWTACSLVPRDDKKPRPIERPTTISSPIPTHQRDEAIRLHVWERSHQCRPTINLDYLQWVKNYCWPTTTRKSLSFLRERRGICTQPQGVRSRSRSRGKGTVVEETWYCSEFVAHCLSRVLGLLPSHVNPCSMTPGAVVHCNRLSPSLYHPPVLVVIKGK